jgi:hypothetical protein
VEVVGTPSSETTAEDINDFSAVPGKMLEIFDVIIIIVTKAVVYSPRLWTVVTMRGQKDIMIN